MEPDPLVGGPDSRIRIHTKISRIRSTVDPDPIFYYNVDPDPDLAF